LLEDVKVALRWYVRKPEKVSYVKKFALADFFSSTFARSLYFHVKENRTEHDGLYCVGGAPPVDTMVEHLNVVVY
jgi:hypothetical protein